MDCRKVPFVLRYHVPDKHKYPEQVCLSFTLFLYPFWVESACQYVINIDTCK